MTKGKRKKWSDDETKQLINLVNTKKPKIKNETTETVREFTLRPVEPGRRIFSLFLNFCLSIGIIIAILIIIN